MTNLGAMWIISYLLVIVIIVVTFSINLVESSVLLGLKCLNYDTAGKILKSRKNSGLPSDCPVIDLGLALAIESIELGAFDGLVDTSVIEFYSNGIRNIEMGTFAGLIKLKELKIVDSPLLVDASFLTNCSSLTRLELTDIGITNIEPGSFANLTKLEELMIDGTPLTKALTVDAGFLKHSPSLTALTITGSQVEYIEPGFFNELSEMSSLYLKHNQLTQLEAGLFNTFTNISEIILSTNKLTYIEENAFKNISIRAGYFDNAFLDLASNQLTHLETGLFDDLSNLKQLGIGDNLLTRLETPLFDSLTNLRDFYAEGSSELRYVAPNLFDSFTVLTVLKLESCPKLKKLPIDIFNSFASKNIILTYKKSYYFECDGEIVDGTTNKQTCLKGVTCNNTLYNTYGYFDCPGSCDAWEIGDGTMEGIGCVSKCKYTTFNISDQVLGSRSNDPDYSVVSNCKILDLSNLNLVGIEDNLFNSFDDLNQLNLLDNYITRLPLALFDGLNLTLNQNLLLDKKTQCSIYAFTLADGHLKRKDQVNNWLQYCENLDLSGYGIETIEEHSFDNMTQLRTLDLTGNKIKVLPSDIFDDLPADCGLVLDEDSKCTTIAFHIINGVLFRKTEIKYDDVNNCEKMNLSNMNFSKIDSKSFKQLNQLTNLDLSYNNLTDLLSNFGEMFYDNASKLQKLNLSSNSINNIQTNVFSQFSNLHALDLRNNQIVSLKKNTVSVMNKGAELDLSNNHINCCLSVKELSILRTKGFGISCFVENNNNKQSLSSLKDNIGLKCQPANIIHEEKDNNNWLIIGITVGLVCGSFVIFSLCMWVFYKKKMFCFKKKNTLLGKDSAMDFVMNNTTDHEFKNDEYVNPKPSSIESDNKDQFISLQDYSTPTSLTNKSTYHNVQLYDPNLKRDNNRENTEAVNEYGPNNPINYHNVRVISIEEKNVTMVKQPGKAEGYSTLPESGHDYYIPVNNLENPENHEYYAPANNIEKPENHELPDHEYYNPNNNIENRKT